ncbi:MAG: Crp/Fnr family transcriptional regulator [Terracidiphilus sp.]|nr:Crp/Fnr family transcriptional regulator [Terracidiphilus sp.]
MQPDARAGTDEGSARPLAELLACPPVASELLNTSSRQIEFQDGDTVFRQGDNCLGLYLVISGDLLRRAERMESRLVLGQVHAGELVELAAALGELRHSYTLTAQSAGSMVMLAFDSLKQAFAAYPPLRMHLLEELAREVSRGYRACCAARMAGIRRRSGVTLALSAN